MSIARLACAEARPLLQAYVDGELDVAGSLALEAHLARCEACRTEHATLRRLRAAIGAGLAPAPAPAALRRAIMQRLRSQAECKSTWWPRGRTLAAVAAMLVLAATALVFGPTVRDQLASPARGERIVYHINETTDPANALRNIANHLQATPGLTAVVVAHNDGIDFLLAGARDRDGHLFEERVASLKSLGVEFRVCGNTLQRRHIETSRIITEAKLVPSGVAEIGRLQAQEGYAYMRL